MYKDTPEEYHFCRSFKFFKVHVLWLTSGLESFATEVQLCVELGIGVEA